MNHHELVGKVAEQSGVDAVDCERVLTALEEILEAELGSQKGARTAFNSVYKVMDFLRKKTDSYTSYR